VPHDAEDYIHRIGRTARASAEGTAVTFINERDQQRFGAIETLLAAVRAQVLARATDRTGAGAGVDAGYGLETEIAEVVPAVIDAAAAAASALARLATPMAALEARLAAMLDDPPDWLDGGGRARVEGAAAGLRLRCQLVAAWTGLLARLGGAADPDFVDWFALARIDGREIDIGIHRHWLDPTRPLAAAVFAPADGVLVTSATLRGGGGWDEAEARTMIVRGFIEPIARELPMEYALELNKLIEMSMEGSVG
jgi:ATP-dependent DNA helicase DinG